MDHISCKLNISPGEKKRIVINEVEYVMCWCPPGTFLMGSPESEEGRYENERQHKVILTEGFWMLKSPVTETMIKSVMGKKWGPLMLPRWEGNNLPIEKIDWNQCQRYINKLNSIATSENLLDDNYVFSLPTEAQWEYACRAGTETPFNFGSVLNGQQANCNGNWPYGTQDPGPNLLKTSEIESYPSNNWGLYDMHGNVWEWTLDWAGNCSSETVTDPLGPPTGEEKILRGGSWSFGARHCRSARRLMKLPEHTSKYFGFRIILKQFEEA